MIQNRQPIKMLIMEIMGKLEMIEHLTSDQTIESCRERAAEAMKDMKDWINRQHSE